MFDFPITLGGGVNQSGGGPAYARLPSPIENSLSGDQRDAEGSVARSVC